MEAGQPTLFLADSKDLCIHLSARLPVRVQLALDEEDKKPNDTSVKSLGIIYPDKKLWESEDV